MGENLCQASTGVQSHVERSFLRIITFEKGDFIENCEDNKNILITLDKKNIVLL